MDIEKLPEKIVLTSDLGSAKKGDTYIRGDLRWGIPESHSGSEDYDDPRWWYWKQGSEQEDNNWILWKWFPGNEANLNN